MNRLDMTKDISERIARQQAFFASNKGGLLICLQVTDPAVLPFHIPAVMPRNEIQWDNEASCRAYARSRMEELRACQAQAARLPRFDDDAIPTIQNYAGLGTLAAVFVHEAVIHQEPDTDYLTPPIQNWSQGIARIGFDPDNIYYRAHMAMLRVYIDAWDGTYGITPFSHFDPLDLCNQWRGNALFYDFQDAPENLTALLAKAANGIIAMENHMRANDMAGYDTRHICVGGFCIPGGNYLSCDAGDMIAPDLLAQWGTPFTQRIVTAWGSAFLHHHELGIHQIVTWSACKGLTLQFLNRDPNTRHLAQVLTDEHLASSFRVPISFIATAEEFLKQAGRWAEGKCAVMVGCTTVEQARAVLKKSRPYRNL